MMSERTSYTSFKQCSNCEVEWQTRNCFISDPDIELIGYQANFEKLSTGLFYFNHSCGSTLAIYASTFLDLYNGPIFEGRATGGEECPGYCLHQEELQQCPAQCECAFVREVTHMLKYWPKK